MEAVELAMDLLEVMMEVVTEVVVLASVTIVYAMDVIWLCF